MGLLSRDFGRILDRLRTLIDVQVAFLEEFSNGTRVRVACYLNHGFDHPAMRSAEAATALESFVAAMGRSERWKKDLAWACEEEGLDFRMLEVLESELESLGEI